MTAIFQAYESSHREPPSFSAQGLSRVLGWRNQAGGLLDHLVRRVAAEVAVLAIALLAIIESVVRPIFALFSLLVEGCDGATYHYMGFKKSVILVLNTPFLLVENIFCNNVYTISI